MRFLAANICNLTYSMANIWRTLESSLKVYFKINLQYFKFQQFMPEAELLRSLIAFPLPIHPPLSLRVLANHYSLLSNLTNKLHCSPQTFAVHTDGEKWLTHRFSLWMNHTGKYKYLQGTQSEKKKNVCGGGHHIKSSAHISIYCRCNL